MRKVFVKTRFGWTDVEKITVRYKEERTVRYTFMPETDSIEEIGEAVFYPEPIEVFTPLDNRLKPKIGYLTDDMKNEDGELTYGSINRFIKNNCVVVNEYEISTSGGIKTIHEYEYIGKYISDSDIIEFEKSHYRRGD